MTTFSGEYQCSVDVKGRIMLPSALKKNMSTEANDRFAVRKDIFDNCLVLYPWDEWELQVKTLRSKLNLYNREQNQFYRNFFQNTAELSLDNTNRMLLPKNLVTLVDIQKDVVLIGLDIKIEIWPKEKFVGGIGNEEAFASLAENLLGGFNNSNV